jgi:hypothetical protein
MGHVLGESHIDEKLFEESYGTDEMLGMQKGDQRHRRGVPALWRRWNRGHHAYALVRSAGIPTGKACKEVRRQRLATVGYRRADRLVNPDARVRRESLTPEAGSARARAARKAA